MSSEEVAPKPQELPPIKSILDCDKVLRVGNGWKCLWCKNSWKACNTSKILHHLARKDFPGVRKCPCRIPDPYKSRYEEMFQTYSNKTLKRKMVFDAHFTANQDHVLRIGDTWNKNKRQKSAVSSGSSAVLGHNDTTTLTMTGGTTACSPLDLSSVAGTPASASVRSGESPNLIQNKFRTTTPTLSLERMTESRKLDFAIAHWIHAKGLPFATSSCPLFQNVISLARTVSPTYVPPPRQKIAGDLLNLNFEAHEKSIHESLLKNAHVFGITLYGDGATVKRMPLINILAAGAYNPAAILEIVDATPHLTLGGKKDATYIAGLFSPHVTMFEEASPGCVDRCIFDGAKNVQNAGRILSVKNPQISVIYGGEHCLALFFRDVFDLPHLKPLVDCHRLFSEYFGGRFHKPYALFCKESRLHNEGRTIGVLRVSEVRMVGYAIAWLRNLRLKPVFESTISSAEFLKDKTCKPPVELVEAIRNPQLWSAAESVIQTVYPALLFLPFADRAIPTMDKMYYYVRRVDNAIEQVGDEIDSMPDLRRIINDSGNVIPIMDSSGNKGDGEDNEEAPETASDTDTDDDLAIMEGTKKLSEKLKQLWNKRKLPLIHDVSRTAWLLSPIPAIQEDVAKSPMEQGVCRNAMERIFKQLFYPQSDEGSVEYMTALNKLMSELEEFQSHTGPFAGRNLWSVDANLHLTSGTSHLWHYNHSFFHTEWLGKLACRVTSKISGMGSAERSWGDVKTLKNGKRSHLSADAINKQSVIYSTHCIETAKREQQLNKLHGGDDVKSTWNDNDLQDRFDLQTKKAARPKRVLKCFMEEWEKESIVSKHIVDKNKILQKYGGLTMFDLDDPVGNLFREYIISSTTVTWEKPMKKRRGGWNICAMSKDKDESGLYETEVFCWDEDTELNPVYAGLLEFYTKNPSDGIELVMVDPTSQNNNSTSSKDCKNDREKEDEHNKNVENYKKYLLQTFPKR